jgi:hypothetical protein
LPLHAKGDYAVSAPLVLAGQGHLSQVKGLSGGGPWEVRWGREILWHGGFEDEGADLWDVNTADEELVNDVAHSGVRSLRLRRLANDSGQTGTDLEKHLPCDPEKQHSAVAWLRAENAHQARVMLRYYNSRYSSTPLADFDLAPRFDGTTAWVRQWRDLDTPAEGVYFDMRCGHEPPSSGTGISWYDDLAFIEWESWQPADQDLEIPAPNNYRFLQVRSADSGAVEVTLAYGETAYDPDPVARSAQDVPLAGGMGLHCFPNPFNPRVTIELEMGAVPTGEVVIEVFDVRGRKIRTLHQGPLPVGIRHGLTWNGQDDRGRAQASGVYLVQARAGGQKVRQKITLLR